MRPALHGKPCQTPQLLTAAALSAGSRYFADTHPELIFVIGVEISIVLLAIVTGLSVVAFMLLTLWAAWQGRWIEQRHTYLKERPTAARLPGLKDPLPYAPRMLWMFGEYGQHRVQVEVAGFWANKVYHRNNPGPDAARARELFPEATIEVVEKKAPA